MVFPRILLALALVSCVVPFRGSAATARVFLLVGQSNMEGKAQLPLLSYQASQPETAELFRPFVSESGEFVERDDVWIRFLDRQGALKAGYGSPNRFGPELGFGWALGDVLEEPVVLIKTAWGGKSLYRDFRPPSSGLPEEAVLNGLLERARQRRPETSMEDIRSSFGHFYRESVRTTKETLGSLADRFPEAEIDGYEIEGIVWFQGWNDMINDGYTAEYTDHMESFIRDLRHDLDAPQAPFVIGQLGVGGVNSEQPNLKRDRFKAAQAEAAWRFAPHEKVVWVATDAFWDQGAQKVFDKGWRDNYEEWEKVGSDYPFHYLGSAKTFLAIGRAFGQAMIQLME